MTISSCDACSCPLLPTAPQCSVLQQQNLSDIRYAGLRQSLLMLLKVVVLLVLCALGPAGSKHGSSKKYFEVELPEDDEYDEGSGHGWGQSPWLEFGQQQVLELEEDEVAHNEMSPEQAAAILEMVAASAASGAAAEAEAAAAGAEPLDPSQVGFFTGSAHMGVGFLDTAADTADAMQFMAVGGRSAQDLLQESFGSAPPFQAASAPPQPASPSMRAPAPGEQEGAPVPVPAPATVGSPTPAPAPSPPRPTAEAPASPSPGTPPPAPPMVQEPSPAPAAAAVTAREAQLPDIGLEDVVLDSLAEDAAAAPAPAAQPPAAAQQQQPQQQQAEGEVKVSLMGRGIWHAKGKVSYPTDPQVPPAASNLAPSGFCDPNLGLEPTDDGRCVCAQGYGSNADMSTCSRCPVGWYSRGGQVGIAFCKPCPQLSTSNPSRTACVVRRNVIRPDVAKSLCEPCIIPTRPFDPPACCPRGQVCCGLFGCCTTKRCINNATTGFEPRCCGDDCNIGQSLNCCPGGQICYNVTGQTNQACCQAGRVCGDAATRSCCSPGQTCCGNRDCCNTQPNAIPQQVCTDNNVTGPPDRQLRCCLTTQINCNGTCCTTRDSPPTQSCLVDATGQAQCCNVVQLCQSAADGITQCCQGSNVCTRNITTTGQQVARCCPAGFSLCPKNNFQPICCLAGRCPSPSSSDNCLAA